MKIENVAVISLEDYAEYQELKKKQKSIDYSKLKTGSVVKLKYTGEHCRGDNNVDFEKTFVLLLKECDRFLCTSPIFHLSEGNHAHPSYNTFIQGDKLAHFATRNVDYITEVISY